MKYAIFQLGSRQYLIKPGQTIKVDKLDQANDTLTVDKVMLIAEDNKLEIGEPYLKKTLDFDVLGNIKDKKIRVATYKAKANYRRVKGSRRELTQIKLKEEAKSVKKA